MAINNSLNFNATTPAQPVLGGTGVSNPTANGVLIANGSSPVSSQLLTNGQVIIGSTGSAPVAATLSAGAGMSIANGAGTITISSTQPVLGGVVDVTGTSQAMTPYTQYISNNAGLVSFSLPASPLAGDWVEIWGEQGTFEVVAGASQVIRLGALVSIAGGKVTSSLSSDSVRVVAQSAGASAVWRVVYSVGNAFDVETV